MLYFLVFIEGFISLAYQMLYIRQLTPEVGASAVTSSWIIGFFLLALALGYKRGGRVVPNPIYVLAKNLVKTGVVGGVAASSLFVGAFFKFMKTIHNKEFVERQAYLSNINVDNFNQNGFFKFEF